MLRSNLFEGQPALERCATSNPAHITPGASGDHVSRIQAALIYLDDLQIDQGELSANFYGRSTAAAVLSYKQKRKIINHSYQTQADDIVGIMTIAALDKELLERQKIPRRQGSQICHRGVPNRTE